MLLPQFLIQHHPESMARQQRSGWFIQLMPRKYEEGEIEESKN